MPTYRADSTTLPVASPQDPDESLTYEFDWTLEMTALSDTITESDWNITSGTALSVGDGVTTFASEAGTVTPAAPSIVSGALKTQVTLYGDRSSTGSVTIENTVRTTGGDVLSRSMRIPVQAR